MTKALKKTQIQKFKEILQKEQHQVVYNDRVLREEYFVNNDDRYDEGDQAASDIAQSMQMRLSNREVLYLRKITEALKRVEDGTFGICENCEEPIELKRLSARPTVTLCVSCKEEQEKFESITAVGRAPKSMGEGMIKTKAM